MDNTYSFLNDMPKTSQYGYGVNIRYILVQKPDKKVN